jgi:hypothetical protein
MKLGIPQVVILGAGASKASFPNGDRNGIQLPLMNDFVETVGLADFLKSNKVEFQGNNFEDLYDNLSLKFKGTPFLDEINERIHNYFAQLRLPDELTIYDKLVLSLRGKDIIATFNWDPFLALAYQRNCQFGELPNTVFLHGNVAIGICLKDKVKGYVWDTCPKCGKKFTPTKLLYPIKQKEYIKDPFIENEWNELEYFLGNAYFFTIFGYSAPNTDIEAINVMKNVYTKNKRRDIAEVEIIDIKPRDELYKSWDDFIVRSHYGIMDDFKYSCISRHPRRSCEGLFMATMQNQPWEDNYSPDFNSLEKFHDWIRPLVEEENSIKDEKKGFCGLPCSELQKKY